ncbi:CapA family protein [Salinactinospora qingdaonensis]|uniref:CapA family protein n=1 Tax=Salinactinospora qingdaonensis TaxID=702744 RepID=A0ABP7G9W5_9ACTN
MAATPLTVFLCGDVMLGRGVDQILPYPGAPEVREPYVADARGYVRLAETANGPIDVPVDFSWPWGDALAVLAETTPDVRVVNLETSVTSSDDFMSNKLVHYRMNPANLPSLSVAHPDVCALANNHVLDFDRRGLAETLDALAHASLRTVGAGFDADQARRPAIVPTGAGTRVVVFSFGMASSGIPAQWAATEERAGVDFVSAPSPAAATEIVERVERVKQPGDVVIASVHWGDNWGYTVTPEQTDFAHALIEGGVDIVHGHSSHHPRPVELYRNGLILYGCGDFINDYEGIVGHEQYRDELRLLYLVSVEPGLAAPTEVRLVPMRARRMRLGHAGHEDTRWLQSTLDRISRDFGSRVGMTPDGALTVRRV